ncbi:MscC3 [Desulforapulum autotrophicum HRM2]|uniref:MscC3 n=1 Tax=Desulforapulum autotrophicum (strain ATCC 43914 / DSM 3382 / VKM B-1955 / HRM2) TaxID=177437 RepID=C0QB55_DESAH|nr:mechanosensitive ion channel family protein [Desulforapulum autotrophicum]ACN14854.1 MscC3 [Desulforapulum autotrophicum HRM2]
MNQLIDSLIFRLREYFSPERLGPPLAELIVDLSLAAIIMAVFYLIWRFVNGLVLPRWKRYLDRTSAAFVETLVKFGILVLGVLAALSAAGIQTTAVLTSLGVVGLTIGFAARDTLSNIISGILIFIDRPFTIDDLVEIDNNYGRVDRITLRSTRIITNDGKMLAVPNTEVMTKTVVSYTNFPHLRLDIDVTVAVTEDLNRVRQILIDLVQQDTDFMANPLPAMVVKSLNDYNVALELRVWLADERLHVQKRFDLREKVFNALTAAGIEMPFETIQLAPHKVAMVEINDDEQTPKNTSL